MVDLAKSHSDCLPQDFSLEPFSQYDPSSILVEPVEPVDSRFGKYGGKCLILRNVLSPPECKYLIQQMSKNMEQVQYRADYRLNDRSIYDAPDLAALLWQRVYPVAKHLSLCADPDPSKQHLLTEEADGLCPDRLQVGYGGEGVWHPQGLNECLRFCRYNPGGFFRPHCDASFTRSEDDRSFFTCMFYLDGDFDGGTTRFLNIEGALTNENYLKLAADDQVLASIKPEPGLCILFFQPGLLHEGEDVKSGVKHMLRTDMMFRRDPSTKVQRTEQELRALDLKNQAEAAEAIGTSEACDRACALYRQAFKLDPKLERML